MATSWSQLSKAKRKKVGCLVVKDGQIISDGYNGTPKGYDNECEFETRFGYETRPEVLHAESNAIAKLARSNESGEDSTLFITHSLFYKQRPKWRQFNLFLIIRNFLNMSLLLLVLCNIFSNNF